MGQYDDRVERQRLLLEAEEWAQGISCIQIHQITSMWYETDFTKKEIEVNGPVTDTTYNNGVIVRTRGDKTIHTFGKELKGDELIDSYCKSTA